MSITDITKVFGSNDDTKFDNEGLVLSSPSNTSDTDFKFTDIRLNKNNSYKFCQIKGTTPSEVLENLYSDIDDPVSVPGLLFDIMNDTDNSIIIGFEIPNKFPQQVDIYKLLKVKYQNNMIELSYEDVLKFIKPDIIDIWEPIY